MFNFILGLVCGVALTLLTPWANDNIIRGGAKNAATPEPAASAAQAQPNDWRFDKSHGTLNQPAAKSR